MTAPTILVTGGTGQVGFELRRELAPLGRVAAPGRAELDLASADSVRDAVRRCRPAVIVNAGAYTAVDRAESELAMNAALNAEAPAVLAEEARALGAVLVHYSTDYVFDGGKAGAYAEDDATCPLNAYGSAKLDGERRIAQVGGAYLVLRTTWVYGCRGHNFLRTVLRLATERPELRIVADQFGAPTWSRMIAVATAQLLARAGGTSGAASGALRERIADAAGVYHLTGAGSTSWHGFATAILDRVGARLRGAPRVVPIATADYPTPARRPRNSLLNSEKLAARFGVCLPDWEAQLDLATEELLTVDGLPAVAAAR